MALKQVFIDCGPDWPAQLDTEAEKVIGGARELSGMPASGPLTTLGVLILLRAFGYDCPPARLWKMLADSRVPEPPMAFGSELVWDTDRIVSLIRVLHEDRQWLPLMHTASKNRREKNADAVLLKQCGELVRLYQTYSTGELELRFEQSQDQATRNVIARLLRDRYAEADQPATEPSPCEPMPSNR
jgi:hypothetical protein